MPTPAGQISASDINTELGLSSTASISLSSISVRVLAEQQGTASTFTSGPIPSAVQKSNPVSFSHLQSKRRGDRYNVTDIAAAAFGTVEWIDIEGSARSITFSGGDLDSEVVVCATTAPTSGIGNVSGSSGQNNFLQGFKLAV